MFGSTLILPTVAQLLKLGLQSWQVRSIYKFRAKGGIFRENGFCTSVWTYQETIRSAGTLYNNGEDYRPASDYYGNSRGGEEERGYQNSLYKNGANTSTYSQANNGANSTNANGNNIYSYPQKLKPGNTSSSTLPDTTELMKIGALAAIMLKASQDTESNSGGFASMTS